MRNRWRASRDGIWALVLAPGRRPHGLCDADRRRPFRVPSAGLPLAATGGSRVHGVVYLGSRVASSRWLRRFSPVWHWVRELAQSFSSCRCCSTPVQFKAPCCYSGGTDGTWNSMTEMLRGYSPFQGCRCLPLPQTTCAPTCLSVRRFAFHETPLVRHRQLRAWKPYENMENGVIPEDALMADGSLGIRFYYLPDLKVIDLYGLTDATVARNPVERPQPPAQDRPRPSPAGRIP